MQNKINYIFFLVISWVKVPKCKKKCYQEIHFAFATSSRSRENILLGL